MASVDSNHPNKNKAREKVGKLLPGYTKADERNLPKIDLFMICHYFRDLRHPAMKHIKMQRSAGEDYGNDAVGYVQLRRTGGQCEVAARVTPEHKVSSCPYRVHVIVDETTQNIVDAKCEDCAAAEGDCKHAIALLGWLERRSSEKSVTSTTSYWKKARLSNVTTETKTTPLKSLRTNPRKDSKTYSCGGRFLAAVIQGAPAGTTGLIFNHFDNTPNRGENLGVDRLLREFLKGKSGPPDCEQFMQFCKVRMTDELCEAVRIETTSQYKSPLWHAVRFGRVTASKAYAVAHSSADINCSLVKLVIGAAKLKDTTAMKRGRELEPRVLSDLKQKIGRVCSTGIYLSPKHPVMGASPDGITDDGQCVVEVKCPASAKSFRTYIKDDGQVAAKHLAQLQMLMHMTEKTQALFCVADPDYELNNTVKIVRVMYDPDYSKSLMEQCQKFWEKTVFLELCNAYSK